MEVDAARGEDGAGGGMQEGAGGLEEEEGGAGTGVAELFDVVGVVAADAGYCVRGAEEGALGGGVNWGAGGRGEGGGGGGLTEAIVGVSGGWRGGGGERLY